LRVIFNSSVGEKLMKINWGVIVSLILIAGVTLWAADSRRNAIDGDTNRATTESAVFTNDTDTSNDNSVMFVVTVGLILGALFFVSNATSQPEAKIAARKLTNRER
jgi:hypothetical protein